MTALDCILDGLEAELALERELGVRVVECDRSLVAGPAKPESVASPSLRGTVTPSQPPPPPQPSLPPKPSEPPTRPSGSATILPFVFLHDRPLSPAGVEMMAKIINALGTTPETTPIVFEKPIPRAKVYIVLGGLALRKFQPTLKGAPGQWLQTAKGAPLLVTYSPEYILRFKEITPAVKKIKQDMWLSLKGVLHRIG